ncbi:MAG: hypothetical protein Q9185_005404 [Variospora sp. 1 TL-2023]
MIRPVSFPHASHLLSILPLLLLSLLVTPTHAVDIQISQAPLALPGPSGYQITIPMQACPSIPPGVCCIARDLPGQPSKSIVFTNLEPLHIAAAWVPDAGRSGCQGKAQATHAGGGRWKYDIPADQPDLAINAGSYIRMPVGNPMGADIGWLRGEGVLGFVTGKSDWWSKDVDKLRAGAIAKLWYGSMRKGHPPGNKVKRFRGKVVDVGKMGMTGPGNSNSMDKRNIVSADKGFVLCQGPRKGVYTSVIELDGAVYRAETPQSPVYVSQDGKVLNFTEPAAG